MHLVRVRRGADRRWWRHARCPPNQPTRSVFFCIPWQRAASSRWSSPCSSSGRSAGRIEKQHGRGRMLTLYIAAQSVCRWWRASSSRGCVPRWSARHSITPSARWPPVGVTIYRSLAGEMTLFLGKLRRVSHLVGVAVAVMVGLMFVLHGLGALGWLAALIVGGCAEPLLRSLPAASALRRSARPRHVVRPSIPPPPDDADVDDILEKISRDGIDSLTPEDRERLEAARRAKLRSPALVRCVGNGLPTVRQTSGLPLQSGALQYGWRRSLAARGGQRGLRLACTNWVTCRAVRVFSTSHFRNPARAGGQDAEPSFRRTNRRRGRRC